MDSIITLIACFVIILIFGSLIGWILPFIIPVMIVGYILYLIFGRKHVHIHTYQSDDSDYTQTQSKPKHDAIDVEYTEHEDEDTNQ